MINYYNIVNKSFPKNSFYSYSFSSSGPSFCSGYNFKSESLDKYKNNDAYKLIVTDYGEYRILDCVNNLVVAIMNSDPFDNDTEKLAQLFVDAANKNTK